MTQEAMIKITELYAGATAEYPQGSYLRKVGDAVEVATGKYALKFPGHESPYFHGGPPFIVMDIADWPWER